VVADQVASYIKNVVADQVASLLIPLWLATPGV